MTNFTVEGDFINGSKVSGSVLNIQPLKGVHVDWTQKITSTAVDTTEVFDLQEKARRSLSDRKRVQLDIRDASTGELIETIFIPVDAAKVTCYVEK